jgi:hypothetical protein
LLGRTTASAGSVEEISVGSGLILAGGQLSSLSTSIRGQYRTLNIINNSGTPNSQVDITATNVILKDASGNSYLAASASLTVAITDSGVNGLDTGSEANSTWYYLYLIWDGTNLRSLLSASSSSPTLPSGYTYFARMGSIYNDSSGNFVAVENVNGKVAYTTNRTIFNGSATAGAWTGISVTAFYPPTAITVKSVMGNPQAVGLAPYSNGNGGEYNTTNQGSNETMSSVLPNTGRSSSFEVLYKDTLYYWGGNTSTYLIATGWTE